MFLGTEALRLRDPMLLCLRRTVQICSEPLRQSMKDAKGQAYTEECPYPLRRAQDIGSVFVVRLICILIKYFIQGKILREAQMPNTSKEAVRSSFRCPDLSHRLI